MVTGRQRSTAMPRWVIGFVIAVAVALVVVGIAMVMGHGLWQHGSMGGIHQ